MFKNLSPINQVFAFILLIIAMGIIGNIIFTLSLNLVVGEEKLINLNWEDPRLRLTATFFGQVFSFLLAFLVFLRLSNEKFSDIVYIQKLKTKPFLITILLVAFSFAILPILELVSAQLEYILPQAVLESEAASAASIRKLIVSQDTTQFVFAIIVMAITPAIFEELVYRGFLIRKMLQSGMSENGAIVLSAVIFSASHMQPLNFLPMFVLGLFLGFVYMHYKNLKYSILLHFLFNGIQITLGYLVANNIISIEI